MLVGVLSQWLRVLTQEQTNPSAASRILLTNIFHGEESGSDDVIKNFCGMLD